jgi:hypothetical protein
MEGQGHKFQATRAAHLAAGFGKCVPNTDDQWVNRGAGGAKPARNSRPILEGMIMSSKNKDRNEGWLKRPVDDE